MHPQDSRPRPRRKRPVWILAALAVFNLAAAGFKLSFAYRLSQLTGGFGAALHLATGSLDPEASYSGAQLMAANMISDAQLYSVAAALFLAFWFTARGYEAEVQALASPD